MLPIQVIQRHVSRLNREPSPERHRVRRVDDQVAIAPELGFVLREAHFGEFLIRLRVDQERIGTGETRCGARGANEVGGVLHHRQGRPIVQRVREADHVRLDVAVLEVIQRQEKL